MPNQKTVLYLSYDGLSDPLGQSQILPYICALAAKSYLIYVISFEKGALWPAQKKIRRNLTSLGVHWKALPYHKKPLVFSTLFDVCKMYWAAREISKKTKVHLIHCRSYIPMLAGIMLKRRSAFFLLFDMRGFWADERVEGNLWNLRQLHYRTIFYFFKKAEILFVNFSDKIVSLTYAGKNELTSGRLFVDKSVTVPEQKIVVIPCAVDFKRFARETISPVQLERLRSSLGVALEDKVLLYLGSIGTWYLMKEMLEFFKAWKIRHPEYKFLIVTQDDPEQIRLQCRKLDIKSSDVVVTASRWEHIPFFLALADLGISFIKPSYSKKASSAVKLTEMLAAGVPVVINKGVGDSDELMYKLLPNNLIDIENMHQSIAAVSTEKVDVEKNIKLLQSFSMESAVKSYASIYEECFSCGKKTNA